MDGLKASLTQSLQFQLSAWLSGVVILLALGAGGYSFWSSFQEANELQDDQLRQVAALISRHDVRIDSFAEDAQDPALEPDLHIVVQLLAPELAPASVPVPLPAQTAGAAGHTAALPLPNNLPDGLQTVRVADESWRLLVRSLRSGQRVAVGQQTAARDEIARDSALRTVLPLLVLVPALAVLVSLVVRHRLKPVARLSFALDQRNEFDLEPLPQMQVPTEIRPFITSISRLLLRLGQSMAAQRRFVADAAHELRSPLTALSLQAEALDGAGLPPQVEAQVTRLRQGVQRARVLIDQLLTLARSQAQPVIQTGPVSAPTILRRVIEDLIPLAEHRQIDLGVTRQDDVHVQMSEVDLTAVMRNLMDNAIRYSPPGGRVDVSLIRDSDDSDGGATLEVTSGGAGIPQAERERVFDPFYRVLGTGIEGSGLGLAIVKTLVERAGGSIALHAAVQDAATPGLRVQVRILTFAVTDHRNPQDALAKVGAK